MTLELEEAPAVGMAAIEPDFSRFVGESRAMSSVLKTITNLLDNDSTVLVLGESGTGKELIARAIHTNSDRSDNPFIIVNCGAIPENLLESELFGHEKGSFTGALRDRVGKFEMADKGTIFLDEIGDMSPSLQVKLLRVLQEREFERVGGARSIRVNTRVIAATNQELEKAIAERRFREDLYYRLNVIPIEVPPLRQRDNDVALLTGHFIKSFNRSKKRAVAGISPEALTLLRAYHWPGNVRELEHLIERLVVLKGGGVIEAADLPPKLRDIELGPNDQLTKDMLLVGGPEELQEARLPTPAAPAWKTGDATSPDAEDSADTGHTPAANRDAWPQAAPPILPDDGISLKKIVDEYETSLIITALERTNWVKNKAAKLLGLNRTTLVEKLKKKKIFKEEHAAA